MMNKSFYFSYKKILFILLPAVLVTAILLFALSFFVGYESYENVRYGDSDSNVMDIYIPKKAYKCENNGCVMFIHGGSWSGGDKAEEELRCRLFASRGYVAVTVNYTLWSEESEHYTVFKVLDELDAALAKTREFAADRGIKLNTAALCGYSAGAHLATLYSYSKAESAPMEIAFVSTMAGPLDIRSEIWGDDMTARIAKLLTGREITEEMYSTAEAYAILDSISPVAYVNESTVPTLIIQGGNDYVVLKENADSLAKKLSENSVPYEYVYLENSDHSLLQNPIKHLGYYKIMLGYCEKYFQ
ncbi:MAG: alpha/beta hydrolase [Clostridia bacterium]|nr:alpha/beta hydrolase [Clostridia bacterium]